jgi:hypothetical protein
MHKLIAGLAAGLVVLVAAPAALAAPVTVDLRIEGASRTLFEAPVTTGVRPFHFTGDTAQHECDATVAASGGTSATPVPTRGAALAAAAELTPFALGGSWSDMYANPTVTSVAGENVDYDPGSGRFLGEYKNGQFASVGSCGDPIATGDRVLFAYTDGSESLLALSGPASARPGASVTVKVTDSANGSAIGGASVGGRTTGSDGRAVVGPFVQRGDQDLKASKAGTVRSNRLRVCVSDGSDGFCGTGAGGAGGTPGGPGGSGTKDTVGPATTLGIKNRKVFSRKKAPRTLRGHAASDPSGLHEVKIRLLRKVDKKCAFFSGGRERWRKTHLCWHGAFFGIGDRADWSYLLPKRLGRGRYRLEAYAIDGAINRGPIKRVRFRVR